MINRKLFIAVILAVSALLPGAIQTVQAQRFSIEIGDRPYYNRGPYYYSHGNRWVWIPGHWSRHRHVWVHGHYERRGGVRVYGY
jgi:hypothetical protein